MFICETCSGSLFYIFHPTEQLITNVCTPRYRGREQCVFAYYFRTFFLRHILRIEIKDWRVAEFIF
jgi:hypothetical protein